jgi:protein SCO1/2
MQNVPIVLRAVAIGLAVFLIACGRDPDSSEAARSYETRGTIKGFSPDREIVEIQHEDIPGFMPSMTMPFTVRNRKELSDRKIGEAISFRMTVTMKDLVLDQVKPIDPEALRLPTDTAAPTSEISKTARLKEGGKAPDFSLTDQDGQRVTSETFREYPFVLTFIFTRCPIPKFCPLMSQHFAELQHTIKEGAGPIAKLRLLSITLDPAFDTPAILKQYGANLEADPGIWTFATGEPAEINRLVEAFSVYRRPEGGTISHALATVLVGSDGTIQKIWRGNGWTPLDITGAIEANGAR